MVNIVIHAYSLELRVQNTYWMGKVIWLLDLISNRLENDFCGTLSKSACCQSLTYVSKPIKWPPIAILPFFAIPQTPALLQIVWMWLVFWNNENHFKHIIKVEEKRMQCMQNDKPFVVPPLYTNITIFAPTCSPTITSNPIFNLFAYKFCYLNNNT